MDKAISLRPDDLFPGLYREPGREKSREAYRPFVLKHAGLCASCKDARLCTFGRDPKVPVMSCEEYNGSAGSAAYGCADRAEEAAEHEPEREEMPLGLCANCAHFESCTFPKFEGGIWQCEEYE